MKVFTEWFLDFISAFGLVTIKCWVFILGFCVFDGHFSGFFGFLFVEVCRLMDF